MASRDIEPPSGKWFFKQIEELKKLQVRVGFTSGKHGRGKQHEPVNAKDYDKGPTVAEIAAWNEFGTSGKHPIPKRPFISQSVDKNRGRINAMCKAQLQGIAKGKKTAKDALQALGALQVGLVQNEIREGGFVKNAESTIRAKVNRNKKLKKSVTEAEIKANLRNDRVITKGKNKGKVVKGGALTKPLIDTGRMRQSVHYVIKPKGEGSE